MKNETEAGLQDSTIILELRNYCNSVIGIHLTATLGFLISNSLLAIISMLVTGWIIIQKRILTAHKVLFGLLLAGTLLVLLGQIVVATTDVSRFWVWFFNMDNDRNIPAIFSALVWFVLVVLLIQHGRNPTLPRLQRIFWWALALVFIWIAFDDYYAFHELIISQWQPVYYVLAAIVGIAGILVFFTWLLADFRQRPMPFIIMAIGVFILGYSAFFLEGYTWDMCDEPLGMSLCRNIYLVRAPDEVFELIAPIFVIVGFSIYIYPQMNENRWQQTLVAWVVTTIVTAIIMVGYFYPLPWLEQKVLAQDVQVEYGDELELIGYWVDNPNPKPGNRINVFLYWKTPDRVRRRYNMSVHLLSSLQQQSYAQADRIEVGQIPASAWFPGLIVRGAIHLDIPEDIPTPASYTISVRVGQNLGDGDEARGLAITNSSLDTLYDDTVALVRIPIISNEKPELLAQSSANVFADNFTLVGYEFPEQSNPDTLPLVLQWQVQKADVQGQYTQFFHIYDGDTFVFGYDEPPFNHHFPTDDWHANATLSYRFEIPLPSDLASGEYRILTGMYDANTQQRLAVSNANADNIIELGTVVIE